MNLHKLARTFDKLTLAQRDFSNDDMEAIPQTTRSPTSGTSEKTLELRMLVKSAAGLLLKADKEAADKGLEFGDTVQGIKAHSLLKQVCETLSLSHHRVATSTLKERLVKKLSITAQDMNGDDGIPGGANYIDPYVQMALKAIVAPGLKTDGVMGQSTLRALQDFIRARGIPAGTSLADVEAAVKKEYETKEKVQWAKETRIDDVKPKTSNPGYTASQGVADLNNDSARAVPLPRVN